MPEQGPPPTSTRRLSMSTRSGSSALGISTSNRERRLSHSHVAPVVSSFTTASSLNESWTAQSDDIREGSAALGNLDLIERSQTSLNVSSTSLQKQQFLNRSSPVSRSSQQQQQLLASNYPLSSSSASSQQQQQQQFPFNINHPREDDERDVSLSPSGLSLALNKQRHPNPAWDSSAIEDDQEDNNNNTTNQGQSKRRSSALAVIGSPDTDPIQEVVEEHGNDNDDSYYYYGDEEQGQKQGYQVLPSKARTAHFIDSTSGSTSFLQSPQIQIEPSSPEQEIRSSTRSSTRRRTPALADNDERSPLLNNNNSNSNNNYNYTDPSSSSFWSRTLNHFFPKDSLYTTPTKRIKSGDIINMAKTPFMYIPAVLLGLLMNVLDALSYGLIMFPTNSPIFADFGGIGVSMYFVSCIACQLICTSQSIFRGGNGSMQIEMIPFLHVITFQIQDKVGMDNTERVVSTTIFAYALSSILTGIVFFALGYLRLGTLVEFFPRHILVGCIGGVGAFLFLTGFEVTARLKGNLTLDLDTLQYMMDKDVLALWLLPFIASLLIRKLSQLSTNVLVFPSFFLIIPLAFYLVVFSRHLSLDQLRNEGWVFVMPQDTPWYEFYKYINFKNTDYVAVLQTLPTQLALVFFAILHVPINVPSVALSIGEDNVDTDKELVNHGLSNLLSGFVFSVPNYLCYVNSVLFYRLGGDSRLAGFMLAGATFALLLIGPWVIGYIPVMVVGILIFILGIDLIKEAVYDTWGRVSKWEYVTIWIIIIIMTLQDFVAGIGAGIVIACGSFVVTSSRRRSIRVVLTGETARSTVRRHPRQDAFLRSVGAQTRVLRLQGFIFFGTTSSCESAIREILETSSTTIRYLVLDFTLVSGIDFSAAESFLRVERLCRTMNIVLVLCGCGVESSVGQALRAVNLWTSSTLTPNNTTEAFETLNSALEHCENSQLLSLYSNDLKPSKATARQKSPIHPPLSIVAETPIDSPKLSQNVGSYFGSPRRAQLVEAAKETLIPEDEISFRASVASGRAQCFALIRQALLPFDEDLSDELIEKASSYLTKVTISKGSKLWNLGDDADSFYVIESGILRALYPSTTSTPSHINPIEESMLPGTISGETSFITQSFRRTTVVAERDCVLWKFSRDEWDKWDDIDPKSVRDLTKVLIRVATEEQEILMGHLFTNL